MVRGIVQYVFDLGSQIREVADGVIVLLNSAGTTFTRLSFGGTTNTFPALARNGASVQVVLADGSNHAGIMALDFDARGAPGTSEAGAVKYGGTTASTVGAAGGASALPATPTGYININVAGAAKKIPYYEP
jgi:hypothetical protein